MKPHPIETPAPVIAYLERVQRQLSDVPVEERAQLMERAHAWLELELDLARVPGADASSLADALQRLDDPEILAQRLRAGAPRPQEPAGPAGRLAACRSCSREVSKEARACPHCGAPWPARQQWCGWGYELKSRRTLFGYPLVHVAFGRDAAGKVRVAKGVIAIGQFAVGGVTIAQFGFGALLGVGQFMIAPISIGQFALGLAAIGQIAIGVLFGLGMFATGGAAIGMGTFGNWLRRG